MRLNRLLVLLWLLLPLGAQAHIGSLTVVYESHPPQVPVRVIIRPPGVVPGLATIDVRVLTNGVKRVTVLPVHWRAGVEGSPPPDVAKPVEGDPNLFHAELWLMARGAYSVHVEVETAAGSSKVIVPVNSLATTRLPMPGVLSGILIGLGVLLFSLAVTVVTAGVRESVLNPGTEPSSLRRWLGRAAGAGAVVMLALAIYGGRAWWNAEDRDYRNNKMHQPVECDVKVRIEDGQRIAQLTVLTNEARGSWPGLVPDHGKLMHVFMMREPQLDVLAHLHPIRRNHRLFEVALPPLPAGNYRLYADVTHETGLSQTLTAMTTVPELVGAQKTEAGMIADADDSWHVSPPSGPASKRFESDLGDGRVMKWDGAQLPVVGREATLRFTIHEPDGSLAKLDAYMGMLGHAAIRRDDGAVFTHLHPAGSVSIAAQQVFQIRAGEKPPKRITPEMMEKLCQPPDANTPQQPLTFPYEFPKPGRYRIWVQVKLGGTVRTGVFDTEVVEAGIKTASK
jgi:hypothetical protein